MILFKDVKQNYPVYILDKQEFCVISGKVTGISFPRVEINQKTSRSETVVDVTVEVDGKTATYAIPENLSTTYAGNIVLSTSKQGLIGDAEALNTKADQILASVQHAQSIKEKYPQVLAELNPMYKDRQETEQRFGKIEGSITEMKGLMQSQQKMLEDFIKKFES